MKYKVILIKHIHSSFAAVSSNDVYVYYIIYLPFKPFKGLNVYDTNDLDKNRFAAEIGDCICWYEKEQCFHCYTPEDMEIYDAQLHHQKHRPIQEIVNEYIEMGWTEKDSTKS